MGVRSLRLRIGFSGSTLTEPTWLNGMRRPCSLVSTRSASFAGSSRSGPALRAITCTVRISSRTSVTGTPVRRNCSCSAASFGDNPINRRRSWSSVKRSAGARSPQSWFTWRICGFERITCLDLTGDVAQLVGIGPDNSEGDGEGRIRSEHELGYSHARLGGKPFGDLRPQPQL